MSKNTYKHRVPALLTSHFPLYIANAAIYTCTVYTMHPDTADLWSNLQVVLHIMYTYGTYMHVKVVLGIWSLKIVQ